MLEKKVRKEAAIEFFGVIKMKEHRCDDFNTAVAGMWSDNEDWRIYGKKLIVRNEYNVKIKFCPFCGEKL